jgi:hypothetical protein
MWQEFGTKLKAELRTPLSSAGQAPPSLFKTPSFYKKLGVLTFSWRSWRLDFELSFSSQ